MKTIILTIILALGAVTMFTACERNDYQHPGYRSNNK
jgi:predicted small secreted protein